jgi:hypothetical protein
MNYGNKLDSRTFVGHSKLREVVNKKVKGKDIPVTGRGGP